MQLPDSVRYVDSHTEGEPTRVVVEGWPALAAETMAGRRAELAARWDALRRAVVHEPRGHDAIVGALLTAPVQAGSAAGVVFFNNAGTLGMCGHGLIGVARTLEHLGRLPAAPLRIDTPVGSVSATCEDDGSVTIENVPCAVHARDVELEVPGLGRVRGDVAWGGNWFFLTSLAELPLELAALPRLLDAAGRIRVALSAAGITGAEGAEIDHVELFGPPRGEADSRNFVLCPGGEYDRSPCGTGTSAKLATLHARGQLALGQRWRQESLTGGVFTAWLSRDERGLIPHVRGRAFVTAEGTLHFDPRDPLRGGFSARA
jgi:4-hydroxyproline epimerase